MLAISRMKILLLPFLVLAPVLLFAQITTRKVSFPTGKSSTNISSSIKGEQTIDYTVSAKAGQEMKVTLTSKSTSLYFNVIPPGSTDEAIFIGSSEGNKFGGTLSADGVYKIRVYLMRSAARRNESANFGLYVSVAGNTSTDAKVHGTNYHATGEVQAATGTGKRGSTSAKFGVIRNADGTAELHLNLNGGLQQKVMFSKGEWKCLSEACKKINYKRIGVDEWELIINDYEHYYIPDAVIIGG
jgi:hypothetical protein